MPEIETHPFQPFVPEYAQYLIVGSFPGKEQTQTPLTAEDWFYGAKRNQFWKILSGVYQRDLSQKISKQSLFEEMKIAVTDILFKVIRTSNSNLDDNLQIVEYNDQVIKKIMDENDIQTIFFTSRFVERHFQKVIQTQVPTICLPSPSPRYARMTLLQKINIYKTLLP